MDVNISSGVNIKKSLLNLSDKNNIHYNDLRVRISVANGKMCYDIMFKNKFVRKSKINDIVKNKLVELFNISLDKIIWDSFTKICKENSCNIQHSDVRLYLNKGRKPKAHLFVKDKAVKNIDIEQLFN